MNVTSGGPADQAGLQPTYRDAAGNIFLGDILLAINDTQIDNMNELRLEIEKYKMGG